MVLFVWKTIFWSAESPGTSGIFILKILNEPCKWLWTLMTQRQIMIVEVVAVVCTEAR